MLHSMFDFEKLLVYHKARSTNLQIQRILLNKSIRPFLRDQLYRASISMVINIAEGTGKLSKNDRKNFYVISRGSVFECASLLDLLVDESMAEEKIVKTIKISLEEISRMLSALINNFSRVQK